MTSPSPAHLPEIRSDRNPRFSVAIATITSRDSGIRSIATQQHSPGTCSALGPSRSSGAPSSVAPEAEVARGRVGLPAGEAGSRERRAASAVGETAEAISWRCGVEQAVARGAHNPEVVGSSPTPATNARSCGSPVGGALPRPTDRPAASSRTRPQYHAAGTTSVVRCRRAGARGRDRGPQSHRTRRQRGAQLSFFPLACSHKQGAALVPSLSRRAS
jgi:hypothetical protein